MTVRPRWAPELKCYYNFVTGTIIITTSLRQAFNLHQLLLRLAIISQSVTIHDSHRVNNEISLDQLMLAGRTENDISWLLSQ